MTSKVYRTAQGLQVDIGAILNQHENTRAVGNMNVNARGDKLNSENKSISTRNQQVNKQYRKQVKRNNVVDEPVYTSRARAPEQQEDVASVEEPEEVVAEVQSEEPSIGIAAAIARARQVKQEPLKSPRQIAQEQDGVHRI